MKAAGPAGPGAAGLDDPKAARRDVAVLIYAVFAAGLCSIVYELLIATAAAYFQGDAVLYFSLTIGLYMAAMGIGAYVSKHVRRNLLARFVQAEIALAAAGGAAVPLLYVAYAAGGEVFLPAYVLLTLLVGFLIGLEIPFLTRLLEGTGPLRDTLAHVLSLDYLGALAATVAFPLLLLPAFGLFASGVGFGLVNVTIAVVVLLRFRDRLTPALRRGCWIATAGAAALLLAGLAASDLLLDRWEQQLYEGRVIHHERTRFQRIVLTAERGDLRLYLDGNLQASSRDEYRYHEALAGVGLAAVAQPRRVLVLGGGDGLAVRELRRDPRVEHVTLMDLDPAVTRLAREHPRLRALNGDALAAGPGDGSKDGARDGPALEILHGDAIRLLRETRDSWDLILVDFPDPNSTALARLYVKEAYGLLEARLAAGGAVVTQATSPLHAPAAFWGIVATVGAVFPGALPYHVQVPSFGQWGFVLATRTPVSVPAVAARIRDGGRFLTPEVFRAATVFAPDVALARAEAQVSTIDRPQVLSDYRAGWRSWGR